MLTIFKNSVIHSCVPYQNVQSFTEGKLQNAMLSVFKGTCSTILLSWLT